MITLYCDMKYVQIQLSDYTEVPMTVTAFNDAMEKILNVEAKDLSNAATDVTKVQFASEKVNLIYPFFQ